MTTCRGLSIRRKKRNCSSKSSCYRKVAEAAFKLGAEQENDKAKRAKLNNGEAAAQGSDQEAAQNNIEAASLVVEDSKAQLAVAQALLQNFLQKRKIKAATALAQKSARKREAARGQAAGAQPAPAQRL